MRKITVKELKLWQRRFIASGRKAGVTVSIAFARPVTAQPLPIETSGGAR